MDWFPTPLDVFKRLTDAGVKRAAQYLYLSMAMEAAQCEEVGILPKTALNRVGIRAESSQISELVSAGFLTEIRDGKAWCFPKLEENFDIVKSSLSRKNTNKERMRRVRSEASGQADCAQHSAREVRALEEEEEEEKIRSNHLSEAAPVGIGGEVSPPPGQPNGWELVRDAIPAEHPHQTRSALAVEASKLLRSGTPAADVKAALVLWLAKPKAGPALLPSLVSEAVKNRATPVQAAQSAPKLKPVSELGLDDTDAAPPERALEHLARARAEFRRKAALKTTREAV